VYEAAQQQYKIAVNKELVKSALKLANVQVESFKFKYFPANLSAAQHEDLRRKALVFKHDKYVHLFLVSTAPFFI
jgi:hypothetical protein